MARSESADLVQAMPPALVKAARLIAWRRLLRLIALGLTLSVLAGTALVIGDAAYGLSDALRRAAVPVLIAGAALLLIAPWCCVRLLRPNTAATVRAVEQALCDRDRELTAAVQLAAAAQLAAQGKLAAPGQLAATVEPVHAELAAAGAARLFAKVPLASLPARLPQPRLAVLLAPAVLAVLALTIAGFVLPDLLPRVLARFADADADHPPWSLRSVAFAEAPARVRVGGEARFAVIVAGNLDAEAMLLCAETSSGRALRLPMYRLGAGRWGGSFADVREAMTVWAVGAGTRTPRHQLSLDPVPTWTGLGIEHHAPAYARLSVQHEHLKPGEHVDLALLPGARVVVTPAANRPLSALRVQRVRDAGSAATAAAVGTATGISTPAESSALTRRIDLDQGGHADLGDLPPGSYVLIAEASTGLPDSRTSGFQDIASDPWPALTIRARRDAPPRAKIVQPTRDALVAPSASVPVVVEADDDLGLTQAVTTLAVGGLEAPPQRRALSSGDANERSWRLTRRIAPGDLGLKAGDVVTLGVLARDGAPTPQWSNRDERRIRVISAEELNVLLRQRATAAALRAAYGPIIDELFRLEAAARAALEPGRDRSERTAAVAAVQRDLAAYAALLAEKRRALPLFKAEPAILDRLEQATTQIADALRAGDASALPSAAAPLREDLDALVLLGRAYRLAVRLRRAIDASQQLAARFAPLADHRRLADDDRVRLRDLAAEGTTLGEAIIAWQGSAPVIADSLRARFPVSAERVDALADAVARTGAPNLLREAAQAARAGDALAARRHADEAALRLLALLPSSAGVEAGLGEASLEFAWANAGAIGDAISAGLGGMGLSSGSGTMVPGFGGDDLGGTDANGNLDIYGAPLSEAAQERGDADSAGDRALAGLAASGEPAGRPGAAAARRTDTGSAAVDRVVLSPAEQALVGDYFRRIGQASSATRAGAK